MRGRLPRLIVAPKFPYARELAYIGSSGTQYIDTGFTPNQNTRVVADVEFPVSTAASAEMLFSSRATYQSSDYSFCSYGGYYRTVYGTQRYNYSTSIAFTGRFVVDKNRNVTTLNGENSYTLTMNSFTCPGPLFLFAANELGTAKHYSHAKIYSLQIYDNDMLVRDFIPVMSNDGLPCMFDKVEKKLYYNEGSGSFIYAEVA